MKLKMLSSNDTLQRRVDGKDQTANAIKTLNKKQNREYLQKSTQLGSQETFTFESSKKVSSIHCLPTQMRRSV